MARDNGKAYAYENGFFSTGSSPKSVKRDFTAYKKPRLHVFSTTEERDEWIKQGCKRAGKDVSYRVPIKKNEVNRLRRKDPQMIRQAVHHCKVTADTNIPSRRADEREVARDTRRRVDAMVMEQRRKMEAKRKSRALEFDGYCSRCRTRHRAVDVVQTQDALGRPVLRGRCSVCGAVVKRNIPKQ